MLERFHEPFIPADDRSEVCQQDDSHKQRHGFFVQVLPSLVADKKELGFIGLSGIATGASWLCYYYAIQNGIVSVVVPIDKMSLLVTVIFSYFAFHEKLSKKAFFGLILMLAGTLAMAIFS